MSDETKIEVVRSFYLGKENPILISILGKNINSDNPSYSFKIRFFDGTNSKTSGDFRYDTKEDAIDGSLDFLADHVTFPKVDSKGLKKPFRKFWYEADLNGELDHNPEGNEEEIPEDFRLNLK